MEEKRAGHTSLHALLIEKANSYLRHNHQSRPKSTFRPPSTPEKPMKANESRPAESITMAMPYIPFGILTSSSCSRMPAKTVRARPKPIAVEKA